MSDLAPRRALGRMVRLVRKEVSTILRDRRTIFTLVLMPILLYPLLTIAFRQFLLVTSLETKTTPEYGVCFENAEDASLVMSLMVRGEQVLRQTPRLADAPVPPGPTPRLIPKGPADARMAVQNKLAELGVRVREPQGAQNFNRNRERALELEVFYLRESPDSREAVELLDRRLDAAHRQFLFERRRDVPPFNVVLLRPHFQELHDPDAKTGISLAALIPLVLILMTITGAVYPAIDLTAGERERGTLEILVAAPIPRLELLFAKYVSVLTVAVLTALVNLGTMTLTLSVSGVGGAVFKGSLSVQVIVQVFCLLLLFAAFFSAVLLTVTSFARSFKEAQAYLVPLMLVSLTPGMMSLLPGLELRGAMTVMPLLNIVLLTRDLLDHKAALGTAVIVVASTLVYALAALALAARVFGAEAVLYSEQTGWGDLFRRPDRPRPLPTLTSALFCLALMFPTSYVLVNVMAGMTAEPGTELLWKLPANLLLFLAIPLVFLWMGRVRLRSGLGLNRLGVLGWPAALLFGVSLWPFADVVNQALQAAGLATLDERLLARSEGQWLRLRQLSPVLVVVCLAVVPAVLEELFFRGFLFNAVRRVSRPRAAILASAVCFGLFHLVGQSFIVVEWGVNSTLLGLLLGWLAWRTGSVVPGMILHIVHNGTLVLLGYFEPTLIAAGWLPGGLKQVPASWLLRGGAGAVLAFLWVFFLCRPEIDTASERE